MKTMMEFPPFRLDLANQCLWCRADGAKEHRILLTPKSFGLLRYLLERHGHLVTQEELLNVLWPSTFVQPEVLKGHIRDIRAALGDDPKKPRFIETLHRRGYRFIAQLTDVSRTSGLDMNSPIARLVGRDLEANWLRESLHRALRGERQIVFVTGESGIGKTALVDSFQRQIVTETPHLRIARGQCVEGYGGKEPYFPILEALGQLCRGPAGDSVVPIIASQAPTWLV